MSNTDSMTKQDAVRAECGLILERLENELRRIASEHKSVARPVTQELAAAFERIGRVAGYLQYDSVLELTKLSERLASKLAENGGIPTPPQVQALRLAVSGMQRVVAEGGSGGQLTTEVETMMAVLNGKPATAPVSVAGPTGHIRSLVVEDDFACRVLLQGLLSKFGDCHIAMNGREALLAFRQGRQSKQPYQLICMDIQMPGMDGREALNQIRDIEQGDGVYAAGVKVLMTTSLRDSQTMFSSFGAKCDDYLVKPVNARKLQDHLLALGLLVKEDSAGTGSKQTSVRA